MKPISDDLRTRLVNVYKETEVSYPTVAARFHVSESSVRRVVKPWRETGTGTPPGGGPPGPLAEAGVARVTEVAKTQADAPQDALRAMVVAPPGSLVSQPTICRTVQRARMPRKNNDMRHSAGSGGCESSSCDL